MWKFGYLALGLILAGCQGGAAPQKTASSPAPTKPRSIVGNWITDDSAKDYTEGIYFRADGNFVRWGTEAEGGWSTGGKYTVKGNRVHFKSQAPNRDNFGPKEDDLEGEAELTWKGTDRIEFSGHGRKLALHFAPKEYQK